MGLKDSGYGVVYPPERKGDWLHEIGSKAARAEAAEAESKRLRDALQGVVSGWQQRDGVEFINVHLDGAAEPPTEGQAVALMRVCLYAARKALGEVAGEDG